MGIYILLLIINLITFGLFSQEVSAIFTEKPYREVLYELETNFGSFGMIFYITGLVGLI